MNDNNSAAIELDHECPQCAGLRRLLKQKHGECWPCAQKRHDRDWKRNEGKRLALAKAAAAKKKAASLSKEPTKTKGWNVGLNLSPIELSTPPECWASTNGDT